MWFFKKKEDTSYKKLKQEIHKNLSGSFQNIKSDMNKITTLVHTKHSEQEAKILMLQRQIDQLEGKMVTMLSKGTSVVLNEEPFFASSPKGQEEKVLQSLTNVQKSILLKLTLLSKENEDKWVPMKSIATDLYPDKDYTTIKSLVSNYTETLMTLGLVEKRRKGRETLISLSSRGKGLVKKQEKPIEEEIDE